MPRPRVHDPEAILDVAESLAVRDGPTAVTIRAVGEAVGVSNGALYHEFGSRQGLLTRAWLRAANRLHAVLRELVDAAGDGAAAIAAAAGASITLAERHPSSAALVLQTRRDELLGTDPPAEVVGAQKRLVDLMVQLAEATWGRRDRAAVDTVTTCIVDLPTAILLQHNRIADPIARRHLRAAVTAVLAVGPAPRTQPKQEAS
ncbi:TetR/AcrR family transcriptional regulator [Mycolicibacterium goodii]|uniref:TetR/AcrR family transcriptional regulator n=1 Tax=Mycolicibacterium goodii TaxID=134601 RepID=UPI000C25E000|nr:TetR/AcrR family transcriptional regulator [Mycolicibacterium goodii]PJK20048.1 TetR family transcriptional regulator [Mycolicibacterium goodii]